MRDHIIVRTGASALRRGWRLIVGLIVVGSGIYVAGTISDAQGRGDLPRGYAVRMTCEKDPESYLWSGGCARVAADIARTDRPSFLELYRAFVTAHHSAIPSPATTRRFARVPCTPGFDVGKTLKGTRFILEPQQFAGRLRARARRRDQGRDRRQGSRAADDRAGGPHLPSADRRHARQPLRAAGDLRGDRTSSGAVDLVTQPLGDLARSAEAGKSGICRARQEQRDPWVGRRGAAGRAIALKVRNRVEVKG